MTAYSPAPIKFACARLFYLLGLGLLMWLGPHGIAGAANKTFTFGIVPQQSAAKLIQAWSPVLQYLSQKSGYTLRFATAKDIPTFEQELAKGSYDFAYMNPYHYVVFHQKPGYQVMAKETGRLLTGIIVVRKDAPYQTLQELNGKTLAFPAPAAFAATVLPLAYSAQQGISLKPKYVTSHESVYLAVAQGLYPAGGGVVRTLDAMPTDIRAQLRVLWTSAGYTPHAIATHPRVPGEAVIKLQNALLGLNADPLGKALLDAINFKGFGLAKDNEWDDVRDLRIDKLQPLLNTPE